MIWQQVPGKNVEQRQVTALTESFRTVMAEVVSGLAIVTVGARTGRPAGLLASSVRSYSVEPPSVFFALGRTTQVFSTMVQADHFGVHFLSAEQAALAHQFAFGRDKRFQGVAWWWDHGVPRLPETAAYLRCARVAMFQYYDHAIFVGQVVDLYLADASPLIYYRRRYDWRLCGAELDGTVNGMGPEPGQRTEDKES